MGKQIKDITTNTTKSVFDPAGLFTTKNTTTAAPAATATAMPDPDGEAVAAAKRRKLAALQARGGRESTLLGGEDLLGG